MVIGAWMHRPTPNRHRRLRFSFQSGKLTEEERRRITLRIGRTPEESVTLFQEQIRNGRPLFLEDVLGEPDE